MIHIKSQALINTGAKRLKGQNNQRNPIYHQFLFGCLLKFGINRKLSKRISPFLKKRITETGNIIKNWKYKEVIHEY